MDEKIVHFGYSATPKTSKKRPVKPFKGDEGKTFDSNYQPSPQAKSEGRKKLMAEKLLTQEILSHMVQGSNLHDYVNNLYKLVNKGNAKPLKLLTEGSKMMC